MQFVAQLGSPVAAGAATNMDGKGGTSEVALALSFAMAITGLLIPMFLWPETLDGRKKSQTSPNALRNDEETTKDTPAGIVREKARSLWFNFRQSVEGIGVISMLLLAVSTLLVSTAIKSIDWLGLIQYPVIKFDWQYKQVSISMRFHNHDQETDYRSFNSQLSS